MKIVSRFLVGAAITFIPLSFIGMCLERSLWDYSGISKLETDAWTIPLALVLTRRLENVSPVDIHSQFQDIKRAKPTAKHTTATTTTMSQALIKGGNGSPLRHRSAMAKPANTKLKTKAATNTHPPVAEEIGNSMQITRDESDITDSPNRAFRRKCLGPLSRLGWGSGLA
jgi:hypothetical protein